MSEGDVDNDPTSFVATWTRGPSGTFNDHKKEGFAIALAGGCTLVEAAAKVGIAKATGYDWAKRSEMKQRKRILRATPAISATFTVSIAMILAELHTNATQAREAGDFKASNDAFGSMYKIAKSEKSLLETYDANVSAKGGANVTKALRDHMRMAASLPQDASSSDPVDADGEDA